mmetsp:Transcript_53361/g.93672  ORF Transcript_53361/g.93672 Transcript_53361/m.93672 type:complete len:254 (-) Transcript_53361:756-1517(-)
MRDSWIAFRNALDFSRQLDLILPSVSGSAALNLALAPVRLCARLLSCTSFLASSGILCAATLNFFLSLTNTFTQIATCFACASSRNLRPQCAHGTSMSLPASGSAPAPKSSTRFSFDEAWAVAIGGDGGRAGWRLADALAAGILTSLGYALDGEVGKLLELCRWGGAFLALGEDLRCTLCTCDCGASALSNVPLPPGGSGGELRGRVPVLPPHGPVCCVLFVGGTFNGELSRAGGSTLLGGCRWLPLRWRGCR